MDSEGTPPHTHRIVCYTHCKLYFISNLVGLAPAAPLDYTRIRKQFCDVWVDYIMAIVVNQLLGKLFTTCYRVWQVVRKLWIRPPDWLARSGQKPTSQILPGPKFWSPLITSTQGIGSNWLHRWRGHLQGYKIRYSTPRVASISRLKEQKTKVGASEDQPLSSRVL